MSLQKHLHWFTILPALLSGFLLAIVTWGPLGHYAQADTLFAFAPPDVTTSPETCDVNGDGKYNRLDVAVLKLYWSGFPDHDVDCTGDGSIDSRDLSILMHNWNGDMPTDIDLPVQIGSPFYAFTYGYHLAIPPAPSDGRKTGDRFTALLLLSTGSTPVGAGEAVLNYDSHSLAVREVRTDPSIWTVWADRPHPPYRVGQLVFSGGRPNGFTGSQGTLAAIQFEVLAPGGESLSISSSSRAYRSDETGTMLRLVPFSVDANNPTFIDLTVNSSTLATVQYTGALRLEFAPSSFNTGPTNLEATRAPTVTGDRWIVDLSPLSPEGGARSYEVREGWNRTVKQDDIYKLSDANPGQHFLQVTVRGPDGTDWNANVIVTVPGQIDSQPLWNRLGFWIAIELSIAALILVMVWRRHTWRVRRDTLARARM